MEEVHGHSYGLTPSGMARTKASHLDLGDVNADFSLEMQGGPNSRRNSPREGGGQQHGDTDDPVGSTPA